MNLTIEKACNKGLVNYCLFLKNAVSLESPTFVKLNLQENF